MDLVRMTNIETLDMILRTWLSDRSMMYLKINSLDLEHTSLKEQNLTWESQVPNLLSQKRLLKNVAVKFTI